MSVYTEEVNLKDGISGPAKSASTELNVLQKALTSAQDKLTVASATGNIKAFRGAKADVDALKSAISALPPAHDAAGAAASKAAGANKDLAAASDAASGSSAGLQAEMAELTGGLSIAIEVIAAVGAAFGAIVIGGASMAIQASEAKAKMTALFDALGEGKVTGKDTIAMLDDLGAQIGQTREKLAPLAKSFMAMGITGTDAVRELTLAAASAEAMAEGGADAFKKLYQQANAAAETGSKFTLPYKKLQAQLVSMGLNVDDLAKAMGKTSEELTSGLKAGTVDARAFADALQQAATSKGAGPLQRAGASLSAVWDRFRENVTKMFEDIDVGPFLEQVKQLFDVFSLAKPSGEAMKSGIGGFFKNVFEVATKLVPMMKHFFLDLVILGLKLYIALKPIGVWFQRLRNNKEAMTTLSKAFDGLKILVVAVAAAVGLVIAAFAIMAAMTIYVGVKLWALIATVAEFVDKAMGYLADWASGAATAAKDFVLGLVNGISSGAQAVVDSVKGLAGKAKDAFKSALGIASPSKEMMKLGRFAGQGVAEGIDATAGQVGSSAADVGAAAKSGAAAGMSGGGAQSSDNSRSVVVNVQPGAIVIQGGSGGSDSDLTEAALSLIFEKLALTAGV